MASLNPSSDPDPRKVARRALGRALSLRGLETPNCATQKPLPGVHVTAASSGPGTQPESAPSSPTPSKTMRIALGADHGGFALKADLIDWVRDLGMLPIDLGTHGEAAVDYPDFAFAVAEAVRAGRADFGVCVDGAGIGSTMVANKVPGIRAANCFDVASAQNAREHNFANVLCLGRLAPGLALDILRAFLSTPTGAARHARRVDKITQIEARFTQRRTP